MQHLAAMSCSAAIHGPSIGLQADKVIDNALDAKYGSLCASSRAWIPMLQCRMSTGMPLHLPMQNPHMSTALDSKSFAMYRLYVRLQPRTAASCSTAKTGEHSEAPTPNAQLSLRIASTGDSFSVSQLLCSALRYCSGALRDELPAREVPACKAH